MTVRMRSTRLRDGLVALAAGVLCCLDELEKAFHELGADCRAGAQVLTELLVDLLTPWPSQDAADHASEGHQD
ncbi:hypothetical protein I541_2927 [Mycobacteroides abscessus]|nr:hypothetical protein I541_2927 [Mycobacteroides abscessus]QST90335.1 hypothetical protein PROPHIGD43A-2_3 [Mycobacterium phage prophiGD43A-2]